MKRIINGVTYNTATATKVAYKAKARDNDRCVTMYQTRKGAFFYHFQNYERSEGHLDDWGYDPKEFVETIATEVFFNPFLPEAEDKGASTTLFLRIPVGLKSRVETAAKDAGQSANAWVLRALEDVLAVNKGGVE